MICHSCLKEKGDMDMCSNCIANQHKAQKYDDLMKANSEIVQNNISHTKIFQENKQLKEKLEKIESEVYQIMNTRTGDGDLRDDVMACFTVEVDGN